MPDLLLELFTEEIPARMQGLAARELTRLIETAFDAARLKPASIESFVTPRRLALSVLGLPRSQPGISEERRGPRVGSPLPAIEGFLKSAGLKSIDECEERTTEKGEFYFAVLKRPGRPTREVLPGLLREVIVTLPWPKSMRFPAASFRWVRPLVSVMSLFDKKILKLDLGSVHVGNTTLGHRFLSPGPIVAHDVRQYRTKLKAAKVVLDPKERRQLIEHGLAKAANAEKLRVKPDEALLDEVVGLVEWPVVLSGRIDAAYMDLPPEVLTTAMRAHQKYFACLDAKDNLAPRFLLVSNMAPRDGGEMIVAGNERVLKARLADARFFWDHDRKVKLIDRVPSLKGRVFHAKLGSVYDKVTRMAKLAENVAKYVPHVDKSKLVQAVWLAKADLSSGMVGEFPELQGVMGRYYALNDGEVPAIANAISEHYSPLGPSDACPRDPESVALALTDKIDTLVGFFAINETPTGSKDPYALRRAALGVIRIILENQLRLPLTQLFQAARPSNSDPSRVLLAFFADRLKVHLKEQGVRHDLIAAVFALGEDDLTRLVNRCAALTAFVKSEDGANLLVAYRRAANILRIEEKKDSRVYSGVPRPDLLQAAEERELDKALNQATVKSAAALKAEDFSVAMTALAQLRGPVDRFFAKVTVNTDDAELRENRLRLLSQIRDTLNLVADFSLIEG
jgi:glycyl-tRNA synthetase beta chain